MDRKFARIAVAAAMLATGAVAGIGNATAAELQWENVKLFEAVKDNGMPPSTGSWYYYAYGSPGGEFDTVADDTEPVHHDGSLRVATPEDDDQLRLNRYDSSYDATTHRIIGPSFEDFTGSYALKVVSGTPAAYSLQVACPRADGSYDGMQLLFAGPFASGPGWQSYDVAQDGQAEWSTPFPVGPLGTESPHTLAEYKALCPGGVIEEHGLRMDDQGSVSYADAVVLNDIATNFQPSANQKLEGTRADDRLVGGRGDDLIIGYAGNDVLVGRGGDDTLVGRKGDDRLRGGDGADTLVDGNGADVVHGAAGPDTIYLRSGADNVYAGPGRDRVVVAADGGPDLIDCGKGVDEVQFSTRRDPEDRFIGCELR